jgi:hypothetical protein
MNQTLQTMLVNYLSERGEPCGFEELWIACGPHSIGEALGDEVIEAKRQHFRRRLAKLVEQGRLHSRGKRADRIWFVPVHEPVIQDRVAQPRRLDVMRGGIWRPYPGPAMRPGADDHRRYASHGARC